MTRLQVGTGYVHESPSIAQRVASAARSTRIGSAFEPTRHPPWTAAFGEAWNQGPTNSCTGFGTVKMVQMMAGHAGIPCGELSPLAIYAWGRTKSGGAAALQRDTGASVSAVAWAFNRFGACNEVFFPGRTLDRDELQEAVHDQPGPAAVANAKRNRNLLRLRLKRIVDVGKRLAQRIAHSLHLQQGVIVALPVNDDFRSGRSVIPRQDPDGWHLVTLLDWRWANGTLQFLIGNSWGARWGNDGMQWASQELIGQASAAYYCEGVAR